MKGINLIIFDFDGTIGDTRRTIVATFRQTLTQLGLPVADEPSCAATIGLPLQDGFAALLPGHPAETIKKCADTYREIFEQQKKKLVPVCFDHVAETLHHLKQEGKTLTIASSRTTASLHDLVGSMGIAEYFGYLLGADDVERAKPDPEPVLKTLHHTGAKGSETLVVGDMPVDILMGKRAGCKTCGVTYGNSDRTALEASGADYVIDSMDQLASIVDQA